MLPDLSAKEEQALRNGMMRVGMLNEGPAILLLFEFSDSAGKPVLTLDAPFDVRVIPRERLNLPSVENDQQRMIVELHGIDDRGILRALRGISFPADFTLRFLSAVQNQIASPASADPIIQRWLGAQTVELFASTERYVCGR